MTEPTNDRIRAALTAIAEAPGRPDELAAWDDVRARVEHHRHGPRRRAFIALSSLAAAAAAIVAVVVLADGDDRETVEVGPIDTPSTVDLPTTTVPTTATSMPSVSLEGFPARPLAVVVSEGDMARLDLYDADTGALVTRGLATSAHSLSDVSFGPDGTVYFSEEFGDTYTVRAVPWDGSAEPVSPFGIETESRDLALSPDGHTIAYVHQGVTLARGEIIIVDTATGDERVLQWAPDEDDFFWTQGRIDSLEWSPDGSRLLFVSSYEGAEPLVIDSDATTLSEAESVEGLSAFDIHWTGPDEVIGLNSCCYPEHDEPRELRRVGVTGGGAVPIAGTDNTINFGVDGAGSIAYVRSDGAVFVLDQDGTLTEIAAEGPVGDVGF